MAFTASNQTAFSYIGRFAPTGTAVAAFAETGYGTVAVQNEGSLGQKTFYSSYALAELVDKDTLSNRYGLLLKVARFFGLQVDLDYLVADFRSAVATGHAPLSVTFNDGTVSNLPVTSWEWDFENDGMMDATTQNWPPHITGTYTVKLRSVGLLPERTRDGFVHVFDVWPLKFDGSSYVDVPAAMSLNVTTFTVKPGSIPSDEEKGRFGGVVSKSTSVFLKRRNAHGQHDHPMVPVQDEHLLGDHAQRLAARHRSSRASATEGPSTEFRIQCARSNQWTPD
jgi:hypothetical protein